MSRFLLVLFIIFELAPVWGSLGNFYFMIWQFNRKEALTHYNGYGCLCGIGGHGEPIDPTDWCCHEHDCCYGELSSRGCKPYLDHYHFKVTGGDVKCHARKTCGLHACECDRLAALCFANSENTYNWKNRWYKKSNCIGSIPECSVDILPVVLRPEYSLTL